MKEKVVNSSILPDWPNNRPLFKYLKKEFAKSLLSDGQLRIGTLFDFRDKEQHGPNRGDDGEGKKTIHEHVDFLNIDDPSISNPLSPFAKQFIKIQDKAKNTTISNCRFSMSYDRGNRYIFCMSKEFDKRFYREFETDTCIKIKSPYKFASCISKNLKKIANFIGLSPVKYTSRSQAYGKHDEYDASIIKTENYKHQKEVRAIWEPKDSSSCCCLPFIIKVPAKCMRRFCEIFDTKE